MPVSGATPIIAATFKKTCAPSQPNTPATTSRIQGSARWSTMRSSRSSKAVVEALDALLAVTSVLLISGTGQYKDLKTRLPEDNSRFQLKAFISENMARTLGAADIVVARAGATTIMELAALAKPTILVPNAYLTGGHQLKNAAAFAEDGAVMVLSDDALEAQPDLLARAVNELLGDEEKLEYMRHAFFKYARPHAAEDVAKLLLAAAK